MSETQEISSANSDKGHNLVCIAVSNVDCRQFKVGTSSSVQSFITEIQNERVGIFDMIAVAGPSNVLTERDTSTRIATEIRRKCNKSNADHNFSCTQK